VPVDPHGTGFAPYLPEQGAEGDSGKRRAARRAIRSTEVPGHSDPVCFCLRVLPSRRGTCCVQILDVGSGIVLDEFGPERLDDLPRVLGTVGAWLSCP
jgi:hypothetical protein